MPNLLDSTLEITRLLQAVVENIDTLTRQQAVLEAQVDGLSAKVVRLSDDEPDCVGRIMEHTDDVMEPGDDSQGNNCYWDIAGMRASASWTAIVGSNYLKIGKARMWILGQQEVFDALVTEDLVASSEHDDRELQE